MVDTGALHSVLTTLVPGAQSQSKRLGYRELPLWANTYGLLEDRWEYLGKGQVSHSILVMPDCPHPLLERDLLTKVGAQISLENDGVTVTDSGGRSIQVLTV